jgi:hypothetical protein
MLTMVSHKLEYFNGLEILGSTLLNDIVCTISQFDSDENDKERKWYTCMPGGGAIGIFLSVQSILDFIENSEDRYIQNLYEDWQNSIVHQEYPSPKLALESLKTMNPTDILCITSL